MMKHIPFYSLCLCLFAACKQTANDSNVKALKPGVSLGDLTKDPNKKQAFVYLANNPLQTEFYRNEKKVLLERYEEAKKIVASDSEAKASIEKAQESFSADYEKFSSAVDKDIDGITKHICNSSTGAIFVTNSNIITETIQYCLPNEGPKNVAGADMETINKLYNEIRSINPIYQHSPLSSERIFSAVLDLVLRIFPPAAYEYSINNKSHGNFEYVTAPKIAYRSGLITSQVIAGHFLQNSFQAAITGTSRRDVSTIEDGLGSKEGLAGKEGLGSKEGLSTKDGLSSLSFSAERASAKELVVTFSPAGITKSKFFEILNKKSSDGMHVNILFLDACNSYPGDEIVKGLQNGSTNIGVLYFSDVSGLDFTSIDDFGKYQKDKSFRTWFAETLDTVSKKI